jgi:CubicO group peptidase (beta-lactamase class C family)
MPLHPPAPLPRALPAQVGLSSTRLAKLSGRMRQAVERGDIPGAVVIVGRRGHIAYEDCWGVRDPATGAPMTPDSIFRIASMTKPITSLAAMMLVEDGCMCLTDPVSQHLPEFATLQVDGASNTAAPALAARAMTVHDLLRHTSGLGYAFTGRHPLKQLYQQHQVSHPDISTAEHVRRLSQLPLLYAPGSTWEYGVSTDVLGHIIERVSGQTLAAFVHARISAPLGLADTAFHAPAHDAQRAAHPQAEGPDHVVPAIPAPTTAIAFASGGGGMVSTAHDYARLCQFFLNGGILDGTRLVSRKTVELMTSNHLPADVQFGADMSFFGSSRPSPDNGYGFGLGFAVRTAAGLNPLPGSVGMYSWSGIYGTSFWVDPREELYGLLMLQSMSMRSVYRKLVQTMVYQAIDD